MMEVTQYFIKTRKKKGMMFINDLLDHNGDKLSIKVFNKKNSLHVNILQNGGFVKSVKDCVFSFSFAPFFISTR